MMSCTLTAQVHLYSSIYLLYILIWFSSFLVSPPSTVPWYGNQAKRTTEEPVVSAYASCRSLPSRSKHVRYLKAWQTSHTAAACRKNPFFKNREWFKITIPNLHQPKLLSFLLSQVKHKLVRPQTHPIARVQLSRQLDRVPNAPSITMFYVVQLSFRRGAIIPRL